MSDDDDEEKGEKKEGKKDLIIAAVVAVFIWIVLSVILILLHGTWWGVIIWSLLVAAAFFFYRLDKTAGTIAFLVILLYFSITLTSCGVYNLPGVEPIQKPLIGVIDTIGIFGENWFETNDVKKYRGCLTNPTTCSVADTFKWSSGQVENEQEEGDISNVNFPEYYKKIDENGFARITPVFNIKNNNLDNELTLNPKCFSGDKKNGKEIDVIISSDYSEGNLLVYPPGFEGKDSFECEGDLEEKEKITVSFDRIINLDGTWKIYIGEGEKKNTEPSVLKYDVPYQITLSSDTEEMPFNVGEHKILLKIKQVDTKSKLDYIDSINIRHSKYVDVYCPGFTRTSETTWTMTNDNGKQINTENMKNSDNFYASSKEDYFVMVCDLTVNDIGSLTENIQNDFIFFSSVYSVSTEYSTTIKQN